ncbi:MAG: SDR family NAD(P)-dependent oxidoreductase [Gaiellaceae bacterium]
MPSELSGKVALVTGGSGGIGSALCERLAAAGALVAVGYSSSDDAAERLVEQIRIGGGSATAVGADLRESDAPAALVAAAETALGPLAILVANHGHSRRREWQEVDAEAWDETLAVNLRASFLLAQRAIPGMQRAGWGRIVFLSSVAAYTGGIVGPDYASSKAALHGLTHFLASRLAGEGITVNAIAPALIEETRMLPGDPGELASLVPVGRLGKPGEVADLIMAVLENGYVTNHVFSIDGGMHPV